MGPEFYQSFLSGGDLLLGWLLALPGDLSLFAVALLTSLTVVLIRRFTTDQELLGRCRADRKRLKALIKEAKAAKDQAARERYRRTDATVGLMLLRAELKPLLCALIPLGLLATWCFERLEYLPPELGAPVTLRFQCPRSAAGRLVHLVPAQGWQSEQGWIKRLTPSASDDFSAEAVWTLTAAEAGPALLRIRSQDQSFAHPVEVGARRYAPVLVAHTPDGRLASSVELRQRQLFGVVPGWKFAGLAPWLVGYLLLTLPLVFLSRAVLRVN